jgi:hypothetical protein
MTDANSAPARHAGCSICGELHDEEYGYQKYGWPDDDSFLPAAVERLVTVRDLKPDSGRALVLKRCPECSTHYLYRTDYEFLVNGSEDEQFLTRLSDEKADELLNGAPHVT